MEKIKETKQKIFKTLALSALILYGIGFIICQGIATTSVIREYDGEYEILLDQQVPLSQDLLEKDNMIVTYEAINDYRVENGLNELQWSDELAECAAVRAEEASVVWSHTRPDGSAWYTVNPTIMYGENLAKGYSAETVIEGWKESPAHNENLLYPDFQYIGLADYNGRIACEFCY